MIEIFQKGGIMMYPLLLASVAALAVLLERLWSLRRKKVLIPEVVAVLEQINTEADFPLAKSVCRKFNGPFPQIMISCLENADLPTEELRLTLEDEGRQQVRSLKRGMGVLETVAGVAPLLGLLGTVLGMISVFNVIEELGVGQAKALSGGIAEALITTAVGLFIGIPALIVYNYLSTRSDSLILDIEQQTLALLNKIIRLKSPEKDLGTEPINLRK